MNKYYLITAVISLAIIGYGITCVNKDSGIVQEVMASGTASSTRYWVGGSGNWDASDTTHWSDSSGGAGGFSVPTASTDVIFNSASNATAYTVTVTATANAFNISFANPASGALTFAGSSDLNVYSDYTILSNISPTHTGTLTFKAVYTNKAITLNGETLQCPIVFDGVNGGWVLQDNLTTINTAPITLTNGSLNANNKNISGGQFSSNNSNVRSLTLGSGTITAAGGWNLTTVTNLTFSADTSTIAITSGANFIGGGLTYNNLTMSGGNPHGIAGNNTFSAITVTGAVSKSAALCINGNQTITGLLTLNGNSSLNRLLIRSCDSSLNDVSQGTQVTISAGSLSFQNVDFTDIVGTGAASWNISAITGNSGDCGGNSGITFTTPVTTNWQSGTTWSTATWSSRVPLCQDTATFTTAGTVTITQDMPKVGHIDFTGSADKTFTTSLATKFYGNINLTNLTALTASTQTWTYSGRGTATITSAGFTWAKSFTILTDSAATLSFGDNFNIGAGSINLTTGTINFNGKTITVTSFNSTGSRTRTATLGSSTINITGAGNWNVLTTGLTVSAGTSQINIASSGKFTGGSKTYNNVSMTYAGNQTVEDSNTFNVFTVSGGAKSIIFTTGTTQTVNNFVCGGSVGNVVTINSSTTGTHSLIKNGGGTISCDYLNIQHSVATPANTWYAGTHSTNNQAVATAGSGWIFTDAPAPLTLGRGIIIITE